MSQQLRLMKRHGRVKLNRQDCEQALILFKNNHKFIIKINKLYDVDALDLNDVEELLLRGVNFHEKELQTDVE